MYDAGITLYPQAIPAAYGVCNATWSGYSPYEIAGVVLEANPAWTYDQAKAFVGLAVLIYCPPDDGRRLYT